jgi:hypothetical protein
MDVLSPTLVHPLNALILLFLSAQLSYTVDPDQSKNVHSRARAFIYTTIINAETMAE